MQKGKAYKIEFMNDVLQFKAFNKNDIKQFIENKHGVSVELKKIIDLGKDFRFERGYRVFDLTSRKN